MARSLMELHEDGDRASLEQRQNRISRVSAAALAAALSALVIGSLVVARTDTALNPAGTTATGTATSGTISLVDDDQGRSLFDLADLAPGQPAVHCLEVVYDGTIVPVDLAMRAEAAGDLSPYLDVVIVEGRGGGFENCGGFEATGKVFDGTLEQVAASGWLELGSLFNSGDRISYQISFELQDEQGALGRSTGTSFFWEVTPG